MAFAAVPAAIAALGAMTAPVMAGPAAGNGKNMPRRLAIAFTATVAIGTAWGLAAAASAGAFGTFTGGGSGLSRGMPHHGGAALRSGPASRSGAFGVRPGGGYAGATPRFGFGGHEGSGWYQPGWGGTLNPGWGYGFGPSLGGVGR